MSFLVVLMAISPAAQAADVQADPSDYRAKLANLGPGDRLLLAAGTYTERLNITNLEGRPDAWITIQGPDGGVATFTANACCNTVEIRDSAYVAIVNLTIDSAGAAYASGVSAKDGLNNLVHHIRVEGCTLLNHDVGGQNHVAISTKTPTWGWIIRNNVIRSAGTGIYLGNSDGTYPFIGGIIEGNLVVDPIGYCMQVKWQKPRPDIAGMPKTPQQTIIRHNVFIKNNEHAPLGDRPNLLVGGFPASGPGAEDTYHIYGNFLFNNPHEALFQASGRVVVHDNLLVGASGTALVLRDHDLPLKVARVYNNTIYGGETGITLGGSPVVSQVVGNLIFARSAISGTIADERGNLVAQVSAADTYVSKASVLLAEMDFYPSPGQCEGPAIDLSAFSQDPDYDRDFNGLSKGSFTFRGAYAGAGSNPGWPLAAEPKVLGSSPTLDGGAVVDSGSVDAGVVDAGVVLDAGAVVDAGVVDTQGDTLSVGGDGNTDTLTGGGCSCQTGPRTDAPLAWLMFFAFFVLVRRSVAGR
ncbi:MAG: hypothetical protein JRH20_29620 [Deltaproteobacteria bacterium]|nr:hypothetical protein [Deltaproteobacteria bacterium]